MSIWDSLFMFLDRLSSLVSLSSIYGRSVRSADVKFFADTSKMIRATSSDSSFHQRFALLTSIMPSTFLLSCLLLRMSARHLVERFSSRASQSLALYFVECTIRRCKNVFMFSTFSHTSSLILSIDELIFREISFSSLLNSFEKKKKNEILNFIPLTHFSALRSRRTK